MNDLQRYSEYGSYLVLLYVSVHSFLHLSVEESACVWWFEKLSVCVGGLSVMLQGALLSPQQLCTGSRLTPQDWTEGRSEKPKTVCVLFQRSRMFCHFIQLKDAMPQFNNPAHILRMN